MAEINHTAIEREVKFKPGDYYKVIENNGSESFFLVAEEADQIMSVNLKTGRAVYGTLKNPIKLLPKEELCLTI